MEIVTTDMKSCVYIFYMSDRINRRETDISCFYIATASYDPFEWDVFQFYN